MDEKVRLVIWDLDETFWAGTLTEGGIRVLPERCQLVRDLAQRGIMSSICSKNDEAAVRDILERAQIWDFFVFPSINWEPKGPRIAGLIEAVQLRPPTVMFIDDNKLNLQEALHFVPGLQVRDHTFIDAIATHPLFTGKPDSSLARLSQYKLLEQRKRDAAASSDDVAGFLRTSHIRVSFEHDVSTQLDRVIELINRTNQLNFTKRRLSEQMDEARAQIVDLLQRYSTQAALIRVTDRYGDHGFCGLYIVNSEYHELLHFCFSCRILGMGVEQWVYARLGRPSLHIEGEVLSDPRDQSRPVDWINQDEASGARAAESMPTRRLLARGGCDLSAISHYLGVHGVAMISEFPVARHGILLRTDHSVFLHYALVGLDDAQRRSAERLLYIDADFRSAIFTPTNAVDCILLSFATDCHHALYRHRASGLVVPCYLGSGAVWEDQRQHDLAPGQDQGACAEVLQALREDFEYCGPVTEADFKRAVRATFTAISPRVPVFVLRPCDHHIDRDTGARHPAEMFVNVNRWTRDIAAGFPNVSLIDMVDFVRSESEVENILHYDRVVYFRVYEHLIRRLQEGMARKQPARTAQLVP